MDQEDSSVPVTINNGADTTSTVFKGGLQVSNEQALSQVPGYTGVEGVADFSSASLTIEDAPESITASLANNAYTGTYVTLDQLTSTDEFNNWKSSSYNICLTWNNMTANIVMTVRALEYK